MSPEVLNLKNEIEDLKIKKRIYLTFISLSNIYNFLNNNLLFFPVILSDTRGKKHTNSNGDKKIHVQRTNHIL